MRMLSEIVASLTPKKKAFVIGSAFVDMVINVHEMPHAGADVEGEYRKTVVGGCSFNVADVLHKLGLPFESYMPVGEGEFSRIVERALTERGYPVYRETGAGDNGWCLSIADHTGERTFISMFGLERKMRPEWFDRFSFADCDYLYVSGYQAEGENGAVLLDVLSRKRPDALVVFDPGPRVTSIPAERLEAFERLGCLYTVNAHEAQIMTETDTPEDAALALARRSGNPAVVTDGARGAVLARAKDGAFAAERIPGFAIRLVDTIGSGDAHTGGVIAGLLCGLPIEEAVLLANAVAAHVSASEGAATAPTREELARYE
jgi:sugar/nucleoside kinase (ribokinase family)